ncbi:MAG TPA: Ig-like domain-containing protein, partial [Thermoplasmata archaeon]|nr:Ig-like domain-containing protein [Thermoplasmata archaeon]
FAWINMSVPAPDTVQSWNFPGAYNVSGVNYTITVNDSLVGLHVFTVWRASHLVVTNSPGVVIALNPINDVLELAGFVEGWQNSSYRQGGFDLHVVDSRVDSWNLYTINSVATVLDSQFGEIIADESSTVTVRNSNLTGHGGYYGVFGNGTLDIVNTTISDQIIGYGVGQVRLQNCTDGTESPAQILAAQGSTIVSVDTLLGPDVTYAATDQGRVQVAATLTVAPSIDGALRAGAGVFVGPSTAATIPSEGTTSSNGTIASLLTYESVRPNGTSWLGALDVAAVSGADVAETTVNLSGPTTVPLPLVPAVMSASPTNNTGGVPGSLDIVLEFAVPMTASLPVEVLGKANHTTTWSDPSTVTIALSGLLPGTAYEIEVPPGGQTAWGVRLAGPYWYNFSTAPSGPTTPVLVVAVPANATEFVSVWTNVSLRFSTTMNAAATESAFSVSPAVPDGVVVVQGEWLNWTHPSPLAANTSYTIVVGPGAQSLDGGGFAHPATFKFVTGSATPPAPPRGTAPGSSGLLVLAVAVLVAAAAVVGVVLWRSRRPPPPEAPAPPPVWAE